MKGFHFSQVVLCKFKVKILTVIAKTYKNFCSRSFSFRYIQTGWKGAKEFT